MCAAWELGRGANRPDRWRRLIALIRAGDVELKPGPPKGLWAEERLERWGHAGEHVWAEQLALRPRPLVAELSGATNTVDVVTSTTFGSARGQDPHFAIFDARSYGPPARELAVLSEGTPALETRRADAAVAGAATAAERARTRTRLAQPWAQTARAALGLAAAFLLAMLGLAFSSDDAGDGPGHHVPPSPLLNELLALADVTGVDVVVFRPDWTAVEIYLVNGKHVARSGGQLRDAPVPAPRVGLACARPAESSP